MAAQFPVLIAFLLPILGALLPRGMISLLVGGAVIGIPLLLHQGWRPVSFSRMLPEPLALLLVGFLIFGFASALWSIDAAQSLKQVLELAGIALAGTILVPLLLDGGPDRRNRLLKALFAGFLIATAIMLIDVTAGLPLHHLARGKSSPAADDLTALNRNMLVLGCLLWPAALVASRRYGPAAVYGLALCWLGIILLGDSQSATLGVISGLITYWAARRYRKAAGRAVTAVLVIAFLGSIPVALLLYRADLAESDWLIFSMRHRVEIWDYAAHQILLKPWLGWGLDASRVMGGPPTEHLPVAMSKLPLHPHCAYLQIWLELGLIGTLLALAFCLVVIRTIQAGVHPSDQPVVLAGIVSLIMFAGVSYGIWQGWWLSTIILCLTMLSAAARRDMGMPKIAGTPATYSQSGTAGGQKTSRDLPPKVDSFQTAI
jgi:exopolysaccharide production protein ExoQ